MYDLTVILPVYNEKDSIATILKEWNNELDRHKITYGFLICEDGSTDGTKEFLKTLKNTYPLTLLSHKARLGYGGAIVNGIRSAQSRYILCVDSDGQYDPRDFSIFWVNRDRADVIFGRRVKRSDPFHRIIFSTLFRIVFSLLFASPVRDPSNPFTLFKKETILPYLTYLSYLSEGFWWGFIGMCVKKKLSIFELPIRHKKRIQGSTSIFHLRNLLPIALKNFIGLVRLKLEP